MTQAADLDFLHLSIDMTVEYQGVNPGLTRGTCPSKRMTTRTGRRECSGWTGWTFRLGAGRDLADDFDALSGDTEVFVPLVKGDNLRQRLVGKLDSALYQPWTLFDTAT